MSSGKKNGKRWQFETTGPSSSSSSDEDDDRDSWEESMMDEETQTASEDPPRPRPLFEEVPIIIEDATTRRRRGRRRRRRRFQICDDDNSDDTVRIMRTTNERQYAMTRWQRCIAVMVMMVMMVQTVSAAPVPQQQHLIKSRQTRVDRMVVDLVAAAAASSNNNTSAAINFQQISKNAFLSLHGTPIEARLPAYQVDDGDPPDPKDQPKIRHHHKNRKKTHNQHPKAHQKLQALGDDVILDGRKHALIHLADPEALKMTQRCDGQKFKQRVRVDGCLTKVVVNRLCHGTCASFFIPRMHSKKLKAAFKSCATCAPSEYDYVDITLTCPGRNPPTATRTIVKVKSCKCREVSISSLYA